MSAFGGTWRPKKRYPSEAEILSRFALRPEEPAPAIAMAHMARDTLIQTLVIVLVITLAVMFLATSFVRPVNNLIDRKSLL